MNIMDYIISSISQKKSLPNRDTVSNSGPEQKFSSGAWIINFLSRMRGGMSDEVKTCTETKGTERESDRERENVRIH